MIPAFLRPTQPEDPEAELAVLVAEPAVLEVELAVPEAELVVPEAEDPLPDVNEDRVLNDFMFYRLLNL